ncbi:MAG: hypothetical protein IKI72_05500 [Bacteroidales bacterium]|nr:hypothetical protein [Bacteroidales bacterium]
MNRILPFLIPAALLLLGTADLPIGYYTILRVVVCIASALIAIAYYSRNERINFGTVLFGIIALIFNPIAPVYLRDKGVWTIIDIISAASFIGAGIYWEIQNKKQERSKVG